MNMNLKYKVNIVNMNDQEYCASNGFPDQVSCRLPNISPIIMNIRLLLINTENMWGDLGKLNLQALADAKLGNQAPKIAQRCLSEKDDPLKSAAGCFWFRSSRNSTNYQILSDSSYAGRQFRLWWEQCCPEGDIPTKLEKFVILTNEGGVSEEIKA